MCIFRYPTSFARPLNHGKSSTGRQWGIEPAMDQGSKINHDNPYRSPGGPGVAHEGRREASRYDLLIGDLRLRGIRRWATLLYVTVIVDVLAWMVAMWLMLLGAANTETGSPFGVGAIIASIGMIGSVLACIIVAIGARHLRWWQIAIGIGTIALWAGLMYAFSEP